jgi:dynein heavy chain
MGEEPEEGEEAEEEEKPPASVTEQKIMEERSNMVVAHFMFSLVWSIGATLDGQSRLKFDEFFRALCDEQNTKHPK